MACIRFDCRVQKIRGGQFYLKSFFVFCFFWRVLRFTGAVLRRIRSRGPRRGRGPFGSVGGGCPLDVWNCATRRMGRAAALLPQGQGLATHRAQACQRSRARPIARGTRHQRRGYRVWRQNGRHHHLPPHPRTRHRGCWVARHARAQ